MLMTHCGKTIRLSVFALAGLALAGCDDAAKRQVRARPPVEPITPEIASGPLPVTPRNDWATLIHPRAAADILIEKVQAQFDQGDQEYTDGRFEDARRDSDLAINWMLHSGFDLRSDPRLEALFDHMVAVLHDREQEASAPVEAVTEQPTEPAPIDEIADITFPLDPRLNEKVIRELAAVPHDLPITVNDEVLSYLNFFQTRRGRAIVETGLRRAGRYREMINRVLQEEGVPLDLIYVAQAESAFRPLALSRARALGVWQFMSYSGRVYGLAHTWWVDERQDPEKSTRAAARYLRDLYQTFGDWYLALAAYNSGAGSVARAVERTGYADFWELHRRGVLPRQTRNYVPIILALTLMAKDPPRYGLSAEPEPALRGDRVKPGSPLDLRLAADTVDVTVEALKELNPQLLRLVTPADPDFELQLPEGTGQQFFAEMAAIPPEKWTRWRKHRVAEGETLGAIARQFRVEARAIAAANDLDLHAELRAGEKLIIPANRLAPSGWGQLVRYRVRRGDTLASIAGQFDVTPSDVRKWNGLSSTKVRRGMVLKLYPGGRPRPTPAAHNKASRISKVQAPARVGGRAERTHTVREGESLWSIARAQSTTVEALRAANPSLSSGPLRVGALLAIPSGGCPVESQKTAC